VEDRIRGAEKLIKGLKKRRKIYDNSYYGFPVVTLFQTEMPHCMTHTPTSSPTMKKGEEKDGF